ncbi:MAG TPA: hypothetical protein VMP10_04000 [Chloroflexota bacterium]|nr:hypothetical protein [Chloroflexota bacterium]
MQQPRPREDREDFTPEPMATEPRREPVVTGPRLVEPAGTTTPAIDVIVPRDLVRWGPIFAGLVATVSLLVVFSVLGVAIGATVAADSGTGQTSAQLVPWIGGLFALIAFFVGGWVAARYAAVAGTGLGVANGAFVWAATLVFTLLIAGSGFGTLIGVIGANVDQIAAIFGTTQFPQAGAPGAVSPQQALATASEAAWITLGVLIAGFAAAALGGWAGARHFIEGSHQRID